MLLDLTPLVFPAPATSPGGGSLPRLRPRQPEPGAGHLHITVNLTGEGRLRSTGHLGILIALSGIPGHIGEADWEAIALALGWEDLL